MPQRHECEDSEIIRYCPDRAPEPACAGPTAAAKGDVYVAYDPAVEATVPTAPKC